MAQGYYTLEEAASLLKMSVDELKMKARRGDIRSFQDRGTWRFRIQDIQELARQRGLGSEPDLVLGDSLNPQPKKTTSGLKKSAVRKSGMKPAEVPPGSLPIPDSQPEVFDFSLEVEDETTSIGKEPLGTGSKSSKKSGPKLTSSGPKSNVSKPISPAPRPITPAPKSPPPEPKSGTQRKSGLSIPEPGSDSDVRLVSDDPNVDFGIEVDSDVRLGATPPPAGNKSSAKSKLNPPSKADPTKRRRSEVAPSPPDSGVRLVPMDSDSDVRIIGPGDSGDALPLGDVPPASSSDSDIRLEFDSSFDPQPEAGMLTDEIDLDAELRKQQEKQAAAGLPPEKPIFAAESPFELSDTDYELPSTGSSIAPGPESDSDSGSSEIELSIDDDKASAPQPIPTPGFDLPPPEEESGIDLGAPVAPGNLQAPSSGISLAGPTDSGISLEQESEGSDEFDLSLHMDERTATPPPSPKDQESSSEFELGVMGDDSSGEMSALDGSSEFELTLDSNESSESSSESQQGVPESSEFELTLDSEAESSSEFELTIDADNEAAAGPDLSSDSEFELQLEETGLDSSSEFELTIDDDLQLAAEEPTPSTDLQEEILTTDLDESPLMEEESGDVVSLEEDTNLEDSDFDIDIEVDEEESSSQVVALEEESDFEEDGAAVSSKGGDDSGFEFDSEAGAGYEEGGVAGEVAVGPGETVIVERDVYATPWSALPVVIMLPCVVVIFLVGLMGFELVQSMNGYREPGLITKAIGGMVGIHMDGK